MSGARGTPLGESARLAGAHAWVEERLYELLGRSATAIDDAELKLLVARHARMHAEHAAWFRSRSPVLAGIDQDSLVVPAGDPATAIAELAAQSPGLAVVAATYRDALPIVLAGYREHLDAASETSDAPTIRSLRLVIGDDEASHREGLACLEHLEPGLR